MATNGIERSEYREYLAGSPRIALELDKPFTWYVFVDKSRQRVEEIKHLKQRFGGTRNIRIRQGDCNDYLLSHIIGNQNINWKTHRALVFLDPFGMQVPWATIESLAKTKAIEIFLNFPVGMAIQRLLRRDGQFSPRERKNLDRYFGSSGWYDTIYRTEKTLFDYEDAVKVADSGRALLNWYRDRLRRVFGYVSRAALIRNTKQGHLYYLLLASPKKTGAKIADQVLSTGEWV